MVARSLPLFPTSVHRFSLAYRTVVIPRTKCIASWNVSPRGSELMGEDALSCHALPYRKRPGVWTRRTMPRLRWSTQSRLCIQGRSLRCPEIETSRGRSCWFQTDLTSTRSTTTPMTLKPPLPRRREGWRRASGGDRPHGFLGRRDLRRGQRERYPGQRRQRRQRQRVLQSCRLGADRPGRGCRPPNLTAGAAPDRDGETVAQDEEEVAAERRLP